MHVFSDARNQILDGGPAGGDDHDGKNDENHNLAPLGFRLIGRIGNHAGFRAAFGVERIFGDHAVFIEAEIVGDGANEATVEHAARQFFPLFFFERGQKARSDAGSQGNFFQGNSPHFTFTF